MDPAPQRPPAVVVVLVDALRPDHLGLYGAARPTSPNLDAWAGGAARYTAAWSPAPATAPAVRSLLAAGDVDAFDPGDHLAHRLAAVGWHTQLLAGDLFLTDAFGVGQGWTVAEHRELAPAAEQVGRAVALLEVRDAPTFQLVHLTDPLLPYPGDQAFAGLFAGEPPTERMAALQPELGLRAQLAAAPLSDAEARWLNARYDQSVRAVDAALAPLIDALGPDDTLVLTADHGEALGEGGRVGHGFALDEAQLRVPLVIRGPGFDAGDVAATATLADVGATALALAGAPVPDGGRDLRHLDGASRPVRLGPTVYGPAQVGLLDGGTRWVMGDAATPEAGWTGEARKAWKAATGQDTRRVWHLQLQPWDGSLEPLTWRGATEVVVRHPAGFAALWAPPLPLHPVPWTFDATPTEVRIHTANGRLPRELLLQPAAPADLDGLELSAVIDGARYDAAWRPEGHDRRAPDATPILTVGPDAKAVSLSVRWAPPP